jgi:CTP synthase
VVIGAYPDIGKGVFISSLGYLLKIYGYQPNVLKFDGYLNFNSGQMNPYHKNIKKEHHYLEEEVFVLKDGFEADVDSGYYERFTNLDLKAFHNMTNGKLINEVVSEKRSKGTSGLLKFFHLKKYLEKWLVKNLSIGDVTLLEIGGTIGDEESIWLYETINRLRYAYDLKIVTIMLSPYLKVLQSNNNYLLSSRTKVTREKFLQAEKLGLRPDIIVLRTAEKHNKIITSDKNYITTDSHLEKELIFHEPNLSNIYEIPNFLEKQGLLDKTLELLNAQKNKKADDRLKIFCQQMNKAKKIFKVGIFGKTASYDSYVSLKEALMHAALELNAKCEFLWLDEITDDQIANQLKQINALILAEGINSPELKLRIFNQTYDQKRIPILAISHAFNQILYTDKDVKKGKFITGAKKIFLHSDKLNKALYNKQEIEERFRCKLVAKKKLPKGKKQWKVLATIKNGLPVMVKSTPHKYCVLALFHPEFQSRPGLAHPIFYELLKNTA